MRTRPLGGASLMMLIAASAWVPHPSFATKPRPIPKASGWVTDLAGLLSPDQRRELSQRMASYKAGSGHEIVLLTLPDLGGKTIEQVALEVGRTWRLGHRDKSDGAILLIAKRERKMRIEVGRGLEGTLTDSISGRIIRDIIVPGLRKNQTYPALRAGIEAMHAAAGGDYAKLPKQRRRRSALTGLIPYLILFFFLAPSIFGRRKGGDGQSLSSRRRRHLGGGYWGGGFGGGGGGFGGFGGGGGFSGGGASGGW